MQAEDRAHRIGQKDSVNVHFLVGDGTLDAIMLKTLQNKIGVVGQVLDGERTSMEAERLPIGGVGEFHRSEIKEEEGPRERKITDYFPSKGKGEGEVRKKPTMEVKEEG